MSKPKSKKFAPTGKGSNYIYGINQELMFANEVFEEYGWEYKISPGSRGAADIIFKPHQHMRIMVQVKSSRANSTRLPQPEPIEYIRLKGAAQSYAIKSGLEVIALMVIRKGGHTIDVQKVAHFSLVDVDQ